MKSTITRIMLAAAMSMAGLLAIPASAAPLLDIAISPNPVQGAPGQDVQIDFTLTNVSALYIDQPTLNYTGANPTALGFLDTSWFDNQGLLLAPGAVLQGFAFFMFDSLAPLNVPETFDVEFAFDTFDALGAPQGFSSELASFDVTAVPEPATLGLLAMALAGAAVTRRRRN